MVEIRDLLLIIQQELMFFCNSSELFVTSQKCGLGLLLRKKLKEAISCMANVAKMCILHDVCLTVY